MYEELSNKYTYSLDKQDTETFYLGRLARQKGIRNWNCDWDEKTLSGLSTTDLVSVRGDSESIKLGVQYKLKFEALSEFKD